MFFEAARQLLAECGGLEQVALQLGQGSPRAAAREAADAELAEREAASILEALAPLAPAVLKGPALAARWPGPRLRPAGDLDLLLEEAALPRAVTILCDRGFRVAPEARGGTLRPTGVELIAPESRFVNADLHARPFRSVGGKLDGAVLLARASPAMLLGQPVRQLDAADELLYLLIHAAKHGACAPKWLLDVWVVTQTFDDWERLLSRARSAGVTRPAWAAARLVAPLPGARIPPPVLAALRPPPPARLLVQSLVRVGGGSPRWQRYARELVLEESVTRRLRMIAGRLLRTD